jgi:hypothetical protein
LGTEVMVVVEVERKTTKTAETTAFKVLLARKKDLANERRGW